MGELCELCVRNGGGDRHLLQGAMVGWILMLLGAAWVG